MPTRFAITIRRPQGEGSHSATGVWQAPSMTTVWTGRVDIIDDIATLKRYTDGDAEIANATAMAFLPDRGFQLVRRGDLATWVEWERLVGGPIVGLQRTAGLVLIENQPQAEAIDVEGVDWGLVTELAGEMKDWGLVTEPTTETADYGVL